MRGYNKFRVESFRNNKSFKVFVKGWFMWRSGFMATNFFSIDYDSLEEALDAIDNYKNRYTLKD